MDHSDAMIKACSDLYLPAFVKAAEVFNAPILSEEGLKAALEIAAFLNAHQQAQADAVIKSAHAQLFAAAGIPTDTPELQEKQATVDPELADALAVLAGYAKKSK